LTSNRKVKVSNGKEKKKKKKNGTAAEIGRAITLCPPRNSEELPANPWGRRGKKGGKENKLARDWPSRASHFVPARARGKRKEKKR